MQERVEASKAVCRPLEVAAHPKLHPASTSGLSVEKELTNGSGERVLPSSSTSSWLLDKVSPPYASVAPQNIRGKSRERTRQIQSAFLRNLCSFSFFLLFSSTFHDYERFICAILDPENELN